MSKSTCKWKKFNSSCDMRIRYTCVPELLWWYHVETLNFLRIRELNYKHQTAADLTSSDLHEVFKGEEYVKVLSAAKLCCHERSAFYFKILIAACTNAVSVFHVKRLFFRRSLRKRIPRRLRWWRQRRNASYCQTLCPKCKFLYCSHDFSSVVLFHI